MIYHDLLDGSFKDWRKKLLQDNCEKNNQEYTEVKLFLEDMQKKGAKLYFDGKAVGSKEAAVRLIREEHQYMADYVIGEKGNVEQIRFDKVNAW